VTEGLLTIRSGDWVIEVDGARGGQIVRADWRGHHVLAPGVQGRNAVDQHAGCFPLVPFSNRIRGGQFVFNGREVNLPPPEYASPHALHGTGWRADWHGEATGPNAARMTLAHEPGAWPWHYRAEQVVRVEGGQLVVTLTLTNLDIVSMPAGIGLHPYFVRPEGFWLKTGVSGRWASEPGEPGLPVRREDAPLDLSAPGLDHCFHGWDGAAEFGGREGLQLTLTGSGAFRNLVIYTPPGKPYFCAEPVSHVNNALNMTGLAPSESMAVLAPGESVSGTMTLLPRLAG
jgi:aldose 1-epimerase